MKWLAKVSAKARGNIGGRRPIMTAARLARARKLIEESGLTVREAAAAIKVSKTALYKALREDGVPTCTSLNSGVSSL